jgi:H+/Na+-translocating ferredoxin:NAD+ oxidoreductase subunit C
MGWAVVSESRKPSQPSRGVPELPQPAPQWPPELLEVALPDRLLVPLGVASAGEVKVKPPGTSVRRGQPLVDQPAESSHVPLAPADGILGAVRPIRLTTGRPAAAVELTVSHQSPQETRSGSPPDNDSYSLVAWLERIRAAGVWADRHASPDLIGQLNQVVARPIDTLICTILDSDASLRLNAAIAAGYADLVIAGVTLLSRITGARRAILAVESSPNTDWLTPLGQSVLATKLQVVDLANDYPQSDPTLMVYSLTHRRLRPGNLPTTRGVLVLDAAAAMAVGNAANRDQPMLTVPVAVHHHLRRQSHFLQVPVGTTVQHVLKALSIRPEETILRGGDLLRDLRLRPDAVIAGGELTIHVTAREIPIIPEPCIRCAWCVAACPTLVNPALLLDAAQRRDAKIAERAGLGACIECGVCAHVCPSELPLLEAIREVRCAETRNSKFE